MPIYEYECRSCGRLHEVMQKYSDTQLACCPECGGETRKLISNTSFVLKGSGWYKTDYASGNDKKPLDKEKSSGASSTEKKTENKSEAA